MKSVLIVDDETGVRQSLKMLLKNDYEVFLAENAKEAFCQINEHSPQVILLDITLPDLDGFKVLERIKQDHPNTIVIVMTGSMMTREMVLDIERFKAYGYVSKPFDISELRLMITQSLTAKPLFNHDH